MPVVPQPVAAPVPERRWKPRSYPGTLGTTSLVRSELRADLSQVSGVAPDLVETVVLCASEMFANAVDHSRSGKGPEGQVIRTLTTPDPKRLRLGIIDDGHCQGRSRSPQIPHQRSVQEWAEAERGRRLLIIAHLAAAWGTRQVVDFPFCQGLGTLIWAEFTLTSPMSERLR